MSLTSTVSFTHFKQIVTRIVEKHMLSTSIAAYRILGDAEPPFAISLRITAQIDRYDVNDEFLVTDCNPFRI